MKATRTFQLVYYYYYQHLDDISCLSVRFLMVLMRINYEQYFLKNLIKIILKVIKIRGIDNIYFSFSYSNKLYIFFK